MSTQNTEYEWFIHPQDAHTNQVIANELGEQAEESYERDVRCADGKRRNLWRIPAATVWAFLESVGRMDLRFRIFNRKGSGQVRDVTSVFKKRRR